MAKNKTNVTFVVTCPKCGRRIEVEDALQNADEYVRCPKCGAERIVEIIDEGGETC